MIDKKAYQQAMKPGVNENFREPPSFEEVFRWRLGIYEAFKSEQPMPGEPDLNRCPGCNGPADNGHDRCLPPSPYYCTKCTTSEQPDRLAKIERLMNDYEEACIVYGASDESNTDKLQASRKIVMKAIMDATMREYGSEWQSIETAPTDGTAILVTDGLIHACVFWDDSSDIFKWQICDAETHYHQNAFTKWMPLPVTTHIEDGETHG